jgi:hypothetical protein
MPRNRNSFDAALTAIHAVMVENSQAKSSLHETDNWTDPHPSAGCCVGIKPICCPTTQGVAQSPSFINT